MKEQGASLSNGNTASAASSVTWIDEEAAQCPSPLVDNQAEREIPRHVASVISILLLGVFHRFISLILCFREPLKLYYKIIARSGGNSTDSSFQASSLRMQMAPLFWLQGGTISSGFDALGNAGWLITSYTLAMCATQSLVSFQGVSTQGAAPFPDRCSDGCELSRVVIEVDWAYRKSR